jgi:SulP family sulfate permease
MSNMSRISKFLPIFDWGRTYNQVTFTNDLVAAVVVTVMLIPQSLAYALFPIVLYAIFGTSRVLAVGPVAVVSLLTAAAVGKIAIPGTPEYIAAAITLAFMSGIILLGLGLFRLGFLANFLSHPVITGFITASGIIIAASQMKHIFGINADGHNILEITISLRESITELNWITLLIGSLTTAFLLWVRKGFLPLLLKLGINQRASNIFAKAGPIIAIVITTLIAWIFSFTERGVKVVGEVPQGLPPISLPSFSIDIWTSLIGSAILMSLIGFIESISIARTLAATKRQRIDPNQELIGLGVANVGAAFTSGFPVTGGFSRSIVNYDAGAETPAAGAFTAIGLGVASLFLTTLIFYLPKATLAATIIVAVLALVDFSILKKTWIYSKADFAAVAATMSVTLIMGVELGVIAGVLISILTRIYKSSCPHIAIVGQVPGTEHYRNVLRHDVLVNPQVLTIRVDESLYFANTRFLEDRIYSEVAKKPDLKHVILMCSAVNAIDMSALESLNIINERLMLGDIKFHLSEVKGPVMDKLEGTSLLKDLSGDIFLSQHQTKKLINSD